MQQDAVVKIIYQIITLALLGLTGFVSGRSKYLPENSGVILSRIVIKLTAPILIFTTMANYDVDSKLLGDALFIYIFGMGFLIMAFLASRILSKAMKLEHTTDSVYKMLSLFGNVIYLAYPLLQVLYGAKGIIYAVFFNLANDTLLWTFGIYLVNRHKTSDWRNNLKHLVNGNTIAFAFGVLFMLANIKSRINASGIFAKEIYTFLFNSFSPLGHTTIYLSMLFIGLILSEVKISTFSELKKRYPLFVLCFFKLLAVPVSALAIMNLFGGVVDSFVKAIIVLQLAMPCGTIVPALASQHDSDYKFATEGVFLTTILSMITLPLVLNLIIIFG